jgi:hypothetical protein
MIARNDFVFTFTALSLAFAHHWFKRSLISLAKLRRSPSPSFLARAQFRITVSSVKFITTSEREDPSWLVAKFITYEASRDNLIDRVFRRVVRGHRVERRLFLFLSLSRALQPERSAGPSRIGADSPVEVHCAPQRDHSRCVPRFIVRYS